MTRRREAWRQRFNRALLALVLEGADLFSAFRRKVSKAAFAVLVGGSVLMVGYLPSTISPSPGASPDPSPAAHIPITEEPLVSAEAVVAMLGDCASCHEIGGDMMATKPFPPIAHKTEGWEQCSFCHAPARLAPVPLNHTEIPDALCQACHKISTTSPPSQGHVLWQGKTCSSCHRASLDLPPTHDDRGDLACVLCHEPAKVAPPSVPHPVLTDEVCAGCHAPADLSAASPRHSDWGEGLCTTCHGADPAGVPTVPHTLVSRAECTFCHVEDSPGRAPGLHVD